MPNNFRKYPLKQEQFKDFEALLYKLKDFQGLEFLFPNSRTFKFCMNPSFVRKLIQSGTLGHNATKWLYMLKMVLSVLNHFMSWVLQGSPE
jgi:hypothetical protein